MKNSGRIIAACLALCILSACGVPAATPTAAPTPVPSTMPETVYYGPEIVDLSGLSDINYLSCQENTCWFTTGNVKRDCLIWQYDAISGEMSSSSWPYVPLSDGSRPKDRYIQSLMAVKGGVIICSNLYTSEGLETVYSLLNESGELVRSLYASSLLPEGGSYSDVPAACALEDGRLYVCSSDAGIVELSPEFEVLRRTAVPEGIGSIKSLVPTEDGFRLWFYVGGSENAIYDLNAETFSFTPADIGLPEGRDFPLVELGIGPDGYGGQGTLADGRIVVLRTDGLDREGCLYIAEPARLETDPRTRLTLAGLDLDRNPCLLEAVAEFNRTSQSCRIAPYDYLRADEVDGSHAEAYARLLEDVYAGDCADIFTTNNLPTEDLAALGLLTDLWPLIDSSGGRGELFEPFLNALSERSGGLYELPVSMTLCTLSGARAELGEGPELSFERLAAAVKDPPEGCIAFTPDLMRSDAMNYFGGIDGFIDWKRGECAFDESDFAALLEFSALFSEEIDCENYEDRGREVRQLFTMTQVYWADGFCSLVEDMGEELELVGLPGTGDRAWFLTRGGWAISASCPDAEEAWEFLSTLVSEEAYEDMDVLPVNRAALEHELAQVSERNPKAAELLYKLLENTSTCRRGYITGAWPFGEMAAETLEGFYAGNMTAEEAAQLMQERAEEYLSGIC